MHTQKCPHSFVDSFSTTQNKIKIQCINRIKNYKITNKPFFEEKRNLISLLIISSHYLALCIDVESVIQLLKVLVSQ